MKNIDKIRAMSAEELGAFLGKAINQCSLCNYQDIPECSGNCEKGITRWLNQEVNPMPEIKIGDVLDVVLEDGYWYDGICVARGIVYIEGECICKEITEVKIKAISRWSSGGMKEVWRAEDE